LSHAQKGIVSMLSTRMDRNDFRFIITAVEDAPRLDGKHIAFGGKGQEGMEVLDKMVKKTFTKKGRPTLDIQEWSLIKIRYALYLYNRRTLIYT